MKKSFIIISIILSLTIQNVISETLDSSKSKQVTAYNVIYGELATILFVGSVSFNYERSLIENFWVRIGYGIGWRGKPSGGGSYGNGPMMMAMYLSSGKNKFEFGLGASYMYIKGDEIIWREGRSWMIPAISIGYRYQPLDEGMLFRVGSTFDYYLGTPFEISVGYAF